MSHTYQLLTSTAYSSYFVDIYIAESHDHEDHVELDINTLNRFMNSLPINLVPRALTDRLFKWSSKIFKVDIKDSSLNIVLLTEIDPEVP